MANFSNRVWWRNISLTAHSACNSTQHAARVQNTNTMIQQQFLRLQQLPSLLVCFIAVAPRSNPIRVLGGAQPMEPVPPHTRIPSGCRRQQDEQPN